MISSINELLCVVISADNWIRYCFVVLVRQRLSKSWLSDWVRPLLQPWLLCVMTAGFQKTESEPWTPTGMVITEFPDVKSAQEFVDSDEYAPVKPMRLNNAEYTLFIVDRK